MRIAPLPYLAIVVGLAALYYGAAKLGLSMAQVVEQISPVWPSTGISIAALLIFGWRVWPGVTIGAFLANFTTNEPFGTACGIAVGNTLEAVIAVALLKRVGFDRSLERLKDVLSLALLGAGVGTAICATIGVTSLCLGGLVQWENFGGRWLVWWLGDATGALLVTPAILAWSTPPRGHWKTRRVVEAVILGVTLTWVSISVFTARFPHFGLEQPLEYVVFPFVVWTALRLGQRGTAAVTLTASAMAIWGSLTGERAMNPGAVQTKLVLLQMFMAAVSLTALLLGAAMSERDLTERRRKADLAVTHILAESGSLTEATPRILQVIGESLEWDLGEIWEVDPQARVLRCVEIWQRPGLDATEFISISRQRIFASGEGLPGRVWASGQPAWISDVTADDNFPRADIAGKDRLRAAFGFPIRVGGVVLGVIEFFSREVRQTDRHLLQMFAALGSQVGQFVDRKRAEDRLRESERNLRLIAENTSDVVFAYDLKRRLLYVNPAFEALTGYTVEELRQSELIDYIHPDDVARMGPQFEGVFRGEPFDNVEFRIITRTGEVKWCLSSWGPLLDARGARIGVQGREHDITERKRAEEALLEADKRKDEFLAMLAHELRNPLAPVTHAVHLIQLAGDDQAALAEARGVLARQVRQMTRLIDDLMDVSRITRNRLELRKQWVDLAAIVANAVETTRPHFQASGHRLVLNLPPEPIRLHADPVRLGQVLSNLLSNAVKYSEPGGDVFLSAAAEGGRVVICVRDSGVGIPADRVRNIFDIFVQLDQPEGRARTGLGIGLTLVKQLVEAHGGSVEVRSGGAGHGSEFVIRLPEMSNVDGAMNDEPMFPAPLSEPSAAHALRLVVADDNIDSAESLGKLLRASGHEVSIAHDGRSALDAALTSRPDAVILDIGMPGMSGYEVARQLRQSPGFEDVTLVALTGWGQEQDRLRSREAGFDRHLVKPVDLDALEQILAEVSKSGRPAARAS